MERTQLEQQMAWRVRRHMLISFGGIAFAILFIGLAGGAARSLAGTPPPLWVNFIPVLGLLMIPAIGFTSTYKNLRCPACDRNVALLASSNYSLFGHLAPKSCPGCGSKIFADDLTSKFRRTLGILFIVVATLAMISVILSAMYSR